MDVKEFAALGGKAKWKGVSKKERSLKMKELARLSRKKRKVGEYRVGKPKLRNTKVIQQAISKKT